MYSYTANTGAHSGPAIAPETILITRNQFETSGEGVCDWKGKESFSMSKQPTHRMKIANSSDAAIDHEAVEAMAYQLWLLRGCPVGSDQEDWYRAEAELKGKRQGNQRAA